MNVIEEMREMNDETRWQAVQTRDVGCNGTFVYGVRSTGIYCKPSCTSRRPRREQVRFFATYQAAETAGFRACKRCQPQQVEATDPQMEMVKRACCLIQAQTEGHLSLATLGAELRVSPSHLQRTFKRVTGVTPRQYAIAHRVSQFKTRVRAGAGVADALYNAGYGSSSRLYEQADAELGMTPAVYRRGGAGMRITYTIVGCALGRLLVAATARGLCAVRLGDSDAELQAALLAEFHAAEIQTDAAALDEWVQAILRHLDGGQTALDLPLDVQATAFQRRVWEALRRIPYGSVRSYGEIAQAIGNPKAVRAVARACATNPVALVTPCHRVIREDGQPGGYRWGIERKQQLLAQEGQQATALHLTADKTAR